MGQPIHIDEIGPEFVWGDVVREHRIDHYVIVEYLPNDGSARAFHPYVTVDPPQGRIDPHFEDTSRGYDSLDQALVHAIVYRNERDNEGINAALNERLTDYIFRIIGQKERTAA